MITSTKTSFEIIGSVTLPVPYSENGTQISLTVSEIFDWKHIALTRCFFIKPDEFIRRLFESARAEWKILDFGDYNISETITTTETSFKTVGSVTLALDPSENGTRISLTASEIFDRKHIALTRLFLYSSSLFVFFFFPTDRSAFGIS